MEIGKVIESARDGQWKPVYVLVGAERFLIDRAVGMLRRAVVDEATAGFNEDSFHGRGLAGGTVVSAASTLPMMAQARFVLVRDAGSIAAAEQEAVARYIANPNPSTCLILVADKLDGRGKLAKAAKKAKVFVDAKPLKGGAVRQFATAEAKARGHRLASDAAAALLDALGEDLAALGDAMERLSLFVGAGQPIDLAAVEACVTRVRTESVWALVDSVSLRNAPGALRAAASLLADREPPLRILALVARQLRMVARMRQALAEGLRGPEAARAAGAPPFKSRDLTEAARRFRLADLGAAFEVIAATDLALKGSKRPGETVLQEALLQLCRPA